MKKLLISFISFFIIIGNIVFCQNVSISDVDEPADPSAMLDIISSSKGLLIPRVVLTTDLNSPDPISNPANGLMIFNQGANQENGIYYWDSTQSKWVKIDTKEAELPDQTGNSGKVLTTNGSNVSWLMITESQNLEDVLISGNDAGTNQIVNLSGLGIGISNTNASAALEVSTTNQGLLLPRLTTEQMNLISDPATGLLIFNLTDHKLSYYNGSKWLNSDGADPNDFDEDGVINDVDNCPNDSNPGQEDYDTDGIGDVCDDCTVGASCDDGDLCTENDEVQANCSCLGTPKDCDDDNPCTIDACNPATGCEYTNTSDVCDDGYPCTTNDQCSGGVCTGTAVDCDDGNPCTDDACNPATGSCEHTNDPTNVCDDGNACTTNDQCIGGVCVGTAVDCDDGNPCTDDACNPATGCEYTNNSNACDDGDACTTNDQCIGGICTGTPVDCDDSNPCTDDSCNPATGCEYTNTSDVCDDGDACTTNDQCSGGVCTGTAVDCDDGNPCTDDACNPATGCEFTSNTSACDDGDPCTHTDVCAGGSCTGQMYTCSDGLSCTTDECNGAGGCIYTINAGYCVIDDVCYLQHEGGVIPCKYCDPDVSQTEWTNVPAGQDPNGDCTGDCDGSGNCE